jgi:hypothetical protein
MDADVMEIWVAYTGRMGDAAEAVICLAVDEAHARIQAEVMLDVPVLRIERVDAPAKVEIWIEPTTRSRDD